MFKSVQVLRKQVKNQYKGLCNTWTFLRPVMGLGDLEPHSQMPNSFHNDFGKFRRLRRVQLLRKHFIKKNKARRVKKKDA